MSSSKALLAAGAILWMGSAIGPEPLPPPVDAVLGEAGGVVEIRGRMEAILLPGTARKDGGKHRIVVEPVAPREPPPEAVGPRPIDRRSSTPLGPVEGPPVVVGKGFRVTVEPDLTDAPGTTGSVDADGLAARRAAVPEGVMPYWEPAREVAREGLLIVVHGAAPAGTSEEVSVWLWSGGGMRREAKGARRGEPVVWDPCLKLGRVDAAGAAWFHLDAPGCGLDERPTWTALREQSQAEFAAWVLERTPEEQHRAVRKELKQMERAETKAAKEN